MKITEFLKSAAVIVVICTVFGLAAFGLNFYTGPIIEANNAGAANDRLNAVMPDGKAYEDITSTLTLPENVVSVNKETSGLGYVIEVTWTSSFTKDGVNTVLVGISTEGKIIKINNETYFDSEGYNIFSKDPNYLASFEGQDSTLADVGLVAGSTYSSTAFKAAVNTAFETLVANDLVTGAQKSDEQILTEMIAEKAPAFTKLKDAAASGNITKALKSEYDTGFALLMSKGGDNYLALVNPFGYCELYDTEGNAVTAANADLVAEAQAYAKANQKDYSADYKSKFEKMFPGAENMTLLDNVSTFSTLAGGVSFTLEGKTYYGFYSRAYGFEQMDMYIVIDEDGKIAKFDAKALIFHEEYFGNFAGMPAGYKDNLIGLDQNSYDGSQTVIATATMTSDAVKAGMNDAFAAFESIKGGAQ